MKLTTCLFLCNDDFDIRKKNPVDIGHFIINGTEEQIMWKLQKNLSAVFAKHKYPDNHQKFIKEIKKQMKKHRVPQICPI